MPASTSGAPSVPPSLPPLPVAPPAPLFPPPPVAPPAPLPASAPPSGLRWPPAPDRASPACPPAPPSTTFPFPPEQEIALSASRAHATLRDILAMHDWTPLFQPPSSGHTV